MLHIYDYRQIAPNIFLKGKRTKIILLPYEVTIMYYYGYYTCSLSHI